jgi:hypothetical protein
MRHFCETVKETAHLGGTDRGALEGATKVMLLLAEATADASWIERLLAARQQMAIPLDIPASERAAELLVTLPYAPDPARRAYVSWMKSQQLPPPQKDAVKRLSEARAKKRPPR